MRPVPDQRIVFLFPAFIVGGQKTEASISDLSDFGLEISDLMAKRMAQRAEREGGAGVGCQVSGRGESGIRKA